MKKRAARHDSEAHGAYNERNNAHIRRIDKNNLEEAAGLIPRDAYYHILDMLKSEQNVGKAIGIVGLRRTGKSTILNQIHSYLSDHLGEEVILHITLSVVLQGKPCSRDALDLRKVSNEQKLIYPKWQDLCSYIETKRQESDIKYILIDEITLCEDLILAGKGLIDQLVNSGVKVVMAGTESFSLQKAYEESLYGRLVLEDISFLSFREYCKLKKQKTDTLEHLNESFYSYLKNGNILDDEHTVDDSYIQTAVGVNIALSILNSDITEFHYLENSPKELTEIILKYIRLIGDNITAETVSQAISHADISRAVSNINSRRKNTDNAQMALSKEARKRMAVESAENAFKKYRLQFGLSDIKLNNNQLNIVDNALSEMGILYSLSHIPCYKNGDKWPQSDDICTLGSFLWFLTSEICSYMESADTGLSDDEIMELNGNIKSAMLGRLIENCIAVHFVKELEKSCDLAVNAKSYANGKYVVNRKCTKMHMYKYNNNVEEDGKSVTAEIDLVLSVKDSIKLIEIKKSTVADVHQIRWLNNETVIDEIVQKISTDKRVEKYVYYMGKPCEADGIHYRNIPAELLEWLEAGM